MKREKAYEKHIGNDKAFLSRNNSFASDGQGAFHSERMSLVPSHNKPCAGGCRSAGELVLQEKCNCHATATSRGHTAHRRALLLRAGKNLRDGLSEADLG